MIPGSGRSPGEGNGSPLQYSHGQGSLAGYGPWGCKGSDTAEGLTHTHMPHSLSLMTGLLASLDASSTLQILLTFHGAVKLSLAFALFT